MQQNKANINEHSMKWEIFREGGGGKNFTETSICYKLFNGALEFFVKLNILE